MSGLRLSCKRGAAPSNILFLPIRPQLRVPRFTETELCRELEELLSYYAQRDRGLISDRVCQTVLTRQKESK